MILRWHPIGRLYRVFATSIIQQTSQRIPQMSLILPDLRLQTILRQVVYQKRRTRLFQGIIALLFRKRKMFPLGHLSHSITCSLIVLTLTVNPPKCTATYVAPNNMLLS